MNPTVRNILAFIIGLVIGGAVNMAIILISPSIIPPPEGADLTTPEGLQASMFLMEPQHFIMPFLAHALGTFVGALVAAGIAVSQSFKIAIGIGVMFLIGGFTSVISYPSPIWFSVLDLVVAYLPMAYLAEKIINNKRNRGNPFGPVM